MQRGFKSFQASSSPSWEILVSGLPRPASWLSSVLFPGSPHGPPRAGPSSSVLLSRSPWNQQSSVAGRSRDQRFIIVPDKSYANVAQVNTTWSPGHRNAIKVRQRTDKTPTRLRTPQPTQRNHLSPRTNKLRTLIIYNRKAKEQTPERLRNLTEKLTHT